MEDLGSTRSVRRCCSSSLIRSLPPHLDRLTEELVIEVLQRLPLKDANRCKCVCKRWLNSISSPYFARCYYNRHCFSFPPPFALFFQYTNTYRWAVPVNLKGIQSANNAYNHPVLNSSGFSFSFLPPSSSSSSSSQPSEPVRFLASSNGLVICSPTILYQKLYYVCNPLTMHWVALPPPPTCHKRVRIGFISTPDFDNGIISRFKVVRIPEFEKDSRLYTDLSLEIFSSETGEWTDFVISWHKPVFGCFFLCDSAVVCNGMLHWRNVYLHDIFAYDPNKTANYQEFRTIPLPKECLNGALVHLFGESQGHLRYAEFHEGTFRVWELEEYSSGEWGLVHKFAQSELVVREDPNLPKFKTRNSRRFITMLAFHPIEGDVMFLDWHGRIFECNMRSRSLKWLCSLAERTASIHRTIFPYVLPWWPLSLPQC
ncbi:hypothetical protein RHGRI_024931 [Rhododendron griersonianum]|uniref:F-box domain-containing protein n=1 Tax=Rhododendron griersonianum TaxID=479676 RepID=A0AAV6JDJ1_9ERIC|nr:hypothetical protein RHGRI_024931 [Rhododendron griersonianum]